MQESRISYCRNCGGNCLFDVADARIERVKTDRRNPVSRRVRLHQGSVVRRPSNGIEPRLLTCLKRNGKGVFEPIHKHQAMSEIEERLDKILKEYGPRSLAMFLDPRISFRRSRLISRRNRSLPPAWVCLPAVAPR
jgi:anaerobic selenocysteine-containing dehydrogenase